MRRHISTAVVFFASLFGFVFLGLPFFSQAGEAKSGYDILKLEANPAASKELTSAGATCKVAVIVLIVLLSIAIVFNIVKLLRDLGVIKIKSWAWTEWVNVALLALITVFAIVAVCGAASYVAEGNKVIKLLCTNPITGEVVAESYAKLKISMGYGVISALVVYVLALGVDIAWSVLRTIKARKEKKA